MNTSISLLLIRISVSIALAFLLIRPQQLLKNRPDDDHKAAVQTSLPLWLLTAFCGFWAGLIIVDAAIFLLLSLVLVGGMSLRQAVPVKTGMVFFQHLHFFDLCENRKGGMANWHPDGDWQHPWVIDWRKTGHESVRQSMGVSLHDPCSC